MIIAEIESFIDCIEELYSLFGFHNRELAFDDEIRYLDPNVTKYEMIENNGGLLFVTLREGNKLVGYLTGFIDDSFHRQSLKVCTVDLFFIHPDYRGQNGLSLMMYAAECELIRRGVNQWFAGTRPTKCEYAGKKLEDMGFKSAETYYYKRIGD